MNYNWTPASTPQGRERLKELADNGICVFAKVHGREGVFYNVLAKVPNPFGRDELYSFLMRLNCASKPFDWYIENGIEFLDPSPTPKADENGLLPCPFCGGKASGIHIPFNFYTVECSACKFFILERETPQLAMSAWNRRAGKEPNA